MHNREQNKTEALAREIYGLIWAQRDAEAEQRLRDLGTDAVPVAHALINGNFRWPPFIQFIGNAQVLIFVFGFVIVPLVYSVVCDVPEDYTDQKWLYYLGLSGGCVITELFVGSFLESFLASRKFVQIRDEADQRKIDTASTLLAATASGDPDLPAAILDALRARSCIYTAPTDPIDARLESALTEALLASAENVLGSLSLPQRSALCAKLSNLRGRMQTAFGDPAGNTDAAKLGTAIIRSFMGSPTSDALEQVRKIAEQDIGAIDQRWAPMVQCAIELLPELEEKLNRSQGKEMLLRASGVAEDSGKELLRAQIDLVETPDEQLLRAVK
jgi:hypothetical protein